MRVLALTVAVVLFATVGCASADPTSSSVAGDESKNEAPESLRSPQSSEKPPAEQASPEANYRLPAQTPGRATAVNRIDTKDRVVFLTIDDGGHEESPTAQILQEKKVPVTSFLTTEFVDHDPEFYGQIAEVDGQIIQNHTVTHPELPFLSYNSQRQQICEASRTLRSWYGAKPWMMRPPYGEYNDDTAAAAAKCGVDYLVLWSVNMPEGGKGTFLYSQNQRFVPGDIILVHWRPNLHQDLLRGLRDIKRQGFRVAALQDYLPRR